MSLSKEILEKLKEELPRLLDHWDPNPQSSDWKCVFCNQRPQAEARNGKWEQIPTSHDSDCFGKQLEKELQSSDCEG